MLDTTLLSNVLQFDVILLQMYHSHSFVYVILMVEFFLLLKMVRQVILLEQ